MSYSTSTRLRSVSGSLAKLLSQVEAQGSAAIRFSVHSQVIFAQSPLPGEPAEGPLGRAGYSSWRLVFVASARGGGRVPESPAQSGFAVLSATDASDLLLPRREGHRKGYGRRDESGETRSVRQRSDPATVRQDSFVYKEKR